MRGTSTLWARQMAEQEQRELHKALLQAQSKADGVLEFGYECGGFPISDEIKSEIARTVELLQRLYCGESS